MSYRYSVIRESAANEYLGRLAAGVAGRRLGLAHKPRVVFFTEDPIGAYEKSRACLGFIDGDDRNRLDIFVRGGRGVAEIIATVFHESKHLSDLERGIAWDDPADWERACGAFQRTAPETLTELEDEWSRKDLQ